MAEEAKIAGEEFECPCCMEDFDPDSEDIVSIETCGHSMCIDCYEAYLEQKMTDGTTCITSTCSDENCHVILPDSVFKRVLSTEKYNRYHFFMYKSYVDMSDEANWCTGKDCEMVVEVKDRNFKTFDVTCSECYECTCFACNKEGHQPISCETMKVWDSRLGTSNKDESTALWIKLNTKTCPTCQTVIQKNAGCMYVNCSQCKNEFCWLCLQKTINHKHTGKCEVE